MSQNWDTTTPEAFISREAKRVARGYAVAAQIQECEAKIIAGIRQGGAPSGQNGLTEELVRLDVELVKIRDGGREAIADNRPMTYAVGPEILTWAQLAVANEPETMIEISELRVGESSVLGQCDIIKRVS